MQYIFYYKTTNKVLNIEVNEINFNLFYRSEINMLNKVSNAVITVVMQSLCHCNRLCYRGAL